MKNARTLAKLQSELKESQKEEINQEFEGIYDRIVDELKDDAIISFYDYELTHSKRKSIIALLKKTMQLFHSMILNLRTQNENLSSHS